MIRSKAAARFERPTHPELPRRAFLFGLSAAIATAQQPPAGKGQNFPSDARRYQDPATEFQVLRLTSPDYTSRLTAYYNRALVGRNVAYFSNDRTGRFEIFRADIKSGQTRLLTSAAQLDPASLALPSGDRVLYYFDGSTLHQLTLANQHDHEIYHAPDGAEHGRGFSITADGARAWFVERAGDKYSLRTVLLGKGDAVTVVESTEEISDPIPRPGHNAALYRRGAAIHVVGADGRNDTGLALAPGEALTPCWSPDGAAILYLNVSPDRGQLNSVRELNLESTTNKLVSKTTQYISFGPNGDASVFVGASGSKASPHVLILIRSVRRELTLCEHHASDPRMVSPVFAPSSQRIYFVSDRHGKPAIYTMNVERFVEETES